MKKFSARLLLTLLAGFPICGFSQIFQTDITVTNADSTTDHRRLTYHRAQNFFDDLSNNGFRRLFSIYNENSQVTANTLYNGVAVNVSFQHNSNTLVFNVPSLGITETFTERTRGQATTALENYLRNDTNGTASRIIEYQVRHTGTSQIAGNPTSLQGQTVSNNFDVAATAPTAPTDRTANAAVPPLFAVGVAGGMYTQGDQDVSIINVPLSYAVGVDSDDPRKKLLLNGQVNYVTIGQAESFQGGLGVAYSHPLSDNWSLIPGVSYGVIGSTDLASLGQLFSTSVASNFRHKIGDYTLSVLNMFGYYRTLPLNVAGIASSPDINNYVIKTGFFAERVLPFPIFGHHLNVKSIFTDTQFLGTRLFVEQYNEVGMQFNTVDKVKWLDTVTFGLADTVNMHAKYVFSIEDPNSFEGFDIGFSYAF